MEQGGKWLEIPYEHTHAGHCTKKNRRTLQEDRNRRGALAFGCLGGLLFRDVFHLFWNVVRNGGDVASAPHTTTLGADRAWEIHFGRIRILCNTCHFRSGISIKKGWSRGREKEGEGG